MSLNAQRGAGMALPIRYPVYNRNKSGGAGDSPVGAGPISLPSGSSQYVPRGQYMIQLGPYSALQIKDPVLGVWRLVDTAAPRTLFISSDGFNYRIINISGCAVGALVTNVGSGYTSAPTVTASAGGSTWTAIVGGGINTTVTVTAGGTLYTYPPFLKISAPPAGGVQATAVAVLTAGAISSVTVTNQGAGYTSAPTIEVIPDPRDTTGSGASLTVNSTLAGSGTIMAVVCTDPGSVLTSVPTLAFSGGGGSSAAATAIMCFALTGVTSGANGAGYGNAQPILFLTSGGIVGGSSAAGTTNPELDKGMFVPRMGQISALSSAGGTFTSTEASAAVVTDPGRFQSVPNLHPVAGGTGLATTVTQATATVGGATDTSYIYPI